MTEYKRRWLASRLREAVEFSSVVVLSGVRQSGKSTLLRNEPPFKDWHYLSFDDLDVLALAEKNPEEIINISRYLVIDEIQRSPNFIYTVKKAIDRDRSRRVVLSGSVNLLLLKRVSESLAGRAIYFNLMPFAYGETQGKSYDGWVSSFFEKRAQLFERLKKYISKSKKPVNLTRNLFRGFLPPAWLLKKESHIFMWWQGYIKTYLERDLRDVSEISNLSDFRKMMQLLALRNSSILKQSEVSRDAALAQATAGRYINILESTGVFLKLKPYTKNISKRLIKSPKCFFIDPGLIASLAGFSSSPSISEEFMGSLLETFVLLNLLVISSLEDAEVYYFRTQGGKEKEVDFVLVKANRVIGIEVKLSETVSVGDAGNMLFLKENLSERFNGGMVVYTGNEVKQLGENIFAIPYWML